MAKGGSLTFEVDAPDSVQLGAEYEVDVTVIAQGNQIGDGDRDRCDNSSGCSSGQPDGWCIQPFVRAPVTGVSKVDQYCIQLPPEDMAQNRVTFTFSLAAPDPTTDQSNLRVDAGFVLPGTAETGGGGGRPESAVNARSTTIQLEGQFSSETPAGPTASIESINPVPGGFELNGSAQAGGSRVTGFGWDIRVRHRSNGGKAPTTTTLNIAGGSNTVARVDAGPYSWGTEWRRDGVIVRLTVHDAANRTDTVTREIDWDTVADTIGSGPMPADREVGSGTITFPDGTTVGGGDGGAGLDAQTLLAIGGSAALIGGAVLLTR